MVATEIAALPGHWWIVVKLKRSLATATRYYNGDQKLLVRILMRRSAIHIHSMPSGISTLMSIIDNFQHQCDSLFTS